MTVLQSMTYLIFSVQVDVVTEAEDGAQVIASWEEARADTPHIVTPEDYSEVLPASPQATPEQTTHATPKQGTRGSASRRRSHTSAIDRVAQLVEVESERANKMAKKELRLAKKVLQLQILCPFWAIIMAICR